MSFDVKFAHNRKPSRLDRAWRRGARGGFTLVELMMSIVIIGILVGFIMVASYQGLERANERATQALIVKLDQGVTERLDALLTQPITPNGTHQFLASIMPSGFSYGTGSIPWGLPSDNRAYVIATLDYLKREMPDVFFIQASPPVKQPTGSDNSYPINFAALGYPSASSTAIDDYLLPLGHTAAAYRYQAPGFFGPGDNVAVGVNTAANSAGIFGASYTARASLNKLLGCGPKGYDAVDNDQDGYIDEWDECAFGLSSTEYSDLVQRMGNHTHETARSEALYALLVGGLGPLGSVFSPEDFKPFEVADTDNDGLPEFVDAWRHPLQFYRWPVHYHSGIQRGTTPYGGILDPRDTAQFDPNNLLMAPSWWSKQFNGIGGGSGAPGDYKLPGGQALLIMSQFTSLYEQNSPLSSGPLWDRSGGTFRRAFFSRPLIISGGPDEQLGLAQLGFLYSRYTFPSGYSAPAGTATLNALYLNEVEGLATSYSPYQDSTSLPTLSATPSSDSTGAVTAGLTDPNMGWGLDDISNHNLQNAGGGIR